MSDNPKNKPWHAMSPEEVLKTLNTDSSKGLTAQEVEGRRNQYGPNELPAARQRPWYVRLLLQFHNVLIYVLIVAAVIAALMDHWIDTVVIAAVVVINAVIGFIQEGKAERALESIRNMLSLKAVVVRDGHKTTVNAEMLVPGDVVVLKSGDKVPADIRIVQARDVRVEESPLTGESTSVTKQVDAVAEDAISGDQLSMLFSGTSLTFGETRGVVVATGTQTELGKINQMMSEVQPITTPLLQKIESFGKWLSVIILGVTGLFFAFAWFFRDYDISELFLITIGLIVASIPEGLPAIMTITLAIGVQRMARRNAIIRRLPSVETLGAVNVICSDKTGTLTRNEMTARMVVTADKLYDVEGVGYEPKGNIKHEDSKVDPTNESVLKRLFQTLRCSNNAEIHEEEKGWQLTGSPTEGALLTLSYKGGMQDFDPERLDSIPFDSEAKYMATLNQWQDGKVVCITGAPDRLLELCTRQLHNDGEKELDKSYWEEQVDTIASRGMRVLGAAFMPFKDDSNSLKRSHLKEALFLGLIGIVDPPRPEVVDAITECREAGIRVKMITGDHAATALAIARELGIGDGEKAITGAELEQMSDDELVEIAEENDVYARTSPEHKLRLVKALQARNLLVAMTGDGVNDAPALKKANIGVAMGIKGTEVSKDASEMVLADDNFTSIVHAVEEGRTVYDNIRKALIFILPTNGGEAFVLMAAVLLGTVMPILPVQILWVNMVTAVTLALALSFERMEAGTMERPPRSRNDKLLGGIFGWRILYVSVVIGVLSMWMFKYMKGLGLEEEAARTVAVNTLVACQMFYLFACRQIRRPAFSAAFFKNKVAFLAGGVLLLLQVGFVYLPVMNTFFGTTPLGIQEWFYPTAAGFAVFLLVEGEKWLVSRFSGGS
ncbi:MAG: cation-transporting P-type ATPase [Cryomorphaceae bacterium]|nr:MAG: cation-transporting P-type ATPase [Cryomorphaceae bacterium]